MAKRHNLFFQYKNGQNDGKKKSNFFYAKCIVTCLYIYPLITLKYEKGKKAITLSPKNLTIHQKYFLTI